ncbi:hypothetical protein NW768_000912 [Fusarium equiseti]|uniref:Uncharacterized protein n=1 Tax=Fusarium equiseti TaxID=61235 RepID=A0ABQ8RU99_FUSEQ|nr:hypothetical protein NW768_000912 [Fusarium equiseti]
MPPHSEKPAEELPTRPDASEAIHQLVSLLNQYCSDGSFDALKGVVGENKELKRDTAKLQTAYDTNIQALSRHQVETKRQKDDFEKQLSSQRAQNEATLKANQAAEDNIKKHKAELSTLQDMLEGQSSSAKQLMNEIKKKESTISSLEAFKASQQEKITKAEKELATLRSAEKSMQSRINDLTGDLEEAHGSLMTFHSIMVKLDKFEARRAEMQMRVAAGLRIYSMALADNVFRSTYLTQNNDLDDVLRDLETEDPLHEAFARAVLLKIQPARQARTKEVRVKMVVDQVSDALADLVPISQRQAFEARLRQVSAEACNAWSVVQQLLEPVRPVFSSHMSEDWVAFPSLTAQRNGKTESSGGAREPLVTRTEKSDRQGQSPTTVSQSMETDDIIQVVWPAFSVPSSQQDDDIGNQVPEMVHRGYVITRSQIKEAENEMSRRNARKNARQNSAHSSTQKKRRDSAVFLSKGFSTGIGTEKGH